MGIEKTLDHSPSSPDLNFIDNIASPKVNGRSSERRLTSSGNKYKTWDEIDLEQVSEGSHRWDEIEACSNSDGGSEVYQVLDYCT